MAIYDTPNRVIGNISITHYEATQLLGKWIPAELETLNAWPDGVVKEAHRIALGTLAHKINVLLEAMDKPQANRATRRLVSKKLSTHNDTAQ